MRKKLDYEFIKSEFLRLKGYILVETEYKNSHTPMKYICPYHPNEDNYVAYGDLKRGSGCKFCYIESRRHSIEFIREEFLRLKGYKLLDDTYINRGTPMRFICPNHPNEKNLKISYGNLLRGEGCRLCANELLSESKRFDIEFIRAEFLRLKGYILLEDSYINNSKKMKYMCPHHPDEDLYISYAALKTGNGCRLCSIENSKHTFDFIKEEFFRLKGYILLENEYINSCTPMKYKCPHHPNEDLYIAYNHLKNGQGCHLCSKVKSRETRIKNIKDDYIIQLKNLNSHIYPIEDYVGCETKIKHRCNKCMNIFEEYRQVVIKSLKSNENCCPSCKKLEKSLMITHPEICEWLADKNDAYKYTSGMSTKIDFVCQDCNSVVNTSISRVIATAKIFCPKCDDNCSYPNKFIFNLLEQLKVDFIPEKSFKWSKRKKYDFYVNFKDIDILIEAHGAQHYVDENQITFKNKTGKDEHENDKLKHDLAIANHIDNYVVIDCRDSNLEYIKNSILESELSELFNIENINWDECHRMACKSRVIATCNLWNDDKYSLNDIATMLKISKTTVFRHLEKGAKAGFCNFKRPGNKRNIICLNTLEVFDSLKSASEKYTSSNFKNISACCYGKRNCAGVLNGEKLVWMFVDEYNKINDNNIIQEKIKMVNSKRIAHNSIKVVCINDNKVFNSIADASNYYGIKDVHYISDYLKGNINYVGKYFNSENDLHFDYYNNYIHKNIEHVS